MINQFSNVLLLKKYFEEYRILWHYEYLFIFFFFFFACLFRHLTDLRRVYAKLEITVNTKTAWKRVTLIASRIAAAAACLCVTAAAFYSLHWLLWFPCAEDVGHGMIVLVARHWPIKRPWKKGGKRRNMISYYTYKL